MAKSSKVDFDPSRPEPLVVRYGDRVVTTPAVDFQDKGVVFETVEPKKSDKIRHVVFVPYSSLVDIRQDYVV